MNRTRQGMLGALALAGISTVTWSALARNKQISSDTVHAQAAAFAAPRRAEEDAAPGQLNFAGKDGKTILLCPLKHTDVKADISGYVTRVNVTQEFQNPTQNAIEAVYAFPLPSDAAVDNMTMTIGNRVIQSEIKRREEAQEIYDTARANGQAAALLDQERPNLFTQSVANITPGATVKITISYVHLLKYDDGEYTFHFPMVVGPRYIGGSNPVIPVATPAGSGPIVTDSMRITPPVALKGTRAGHDISLSVRLNAGFPMADLRSVLHEVDIRQARGASSGVAEIALKDRQTIPNQDFILKYRVGGPAIQSGVLTHADSRKGGFFTVVVQPPNAPIPADITAKEMVFVIDQTGSQSGPPIAKAKETMRHCIQNLNPGDTFQLIGFNTSLFPCFERPVPANSETIAKALAFLEPIEGNGGTDILKSVEYALKLPDDPNRLRIVCYMTDGYVGNDMQIINTIQKERGRARMFPFGVGNSVNRFLIDGMATEGKGVAEYVALTEDGKTAAERFYRRIAKPLLMNISVDWNGLPVTDVYPQQIPDLFTAGPIILKGRYTQAASGDIVIHGLLRGRPWSQRVRINLPAQSSDGGQIATLWARDRIEHLQRQDWMGAQTGKPESSIKEQIIGTALDYRLMSQYTSFVAVEQRVINQGGRNVRINVPVELPNGAFGGERRLEEQERLGYGFQSMGRSRGAVAFSNSLSAGVNPAPQGRSRPLGASGGYGGGFAGGGRAALGDSTTAYDSDGSLIVRGDSVGMKLHPLLIQLTARVKKEGKDGSLAIPGKLVVKSLNVEVQISLNKLPKDGLAKLKALGLANIATLTPSKLLLGWVPVANLEKIAKLDYVRRISPPSYSK